MSPDGNTGAQESSSLQPRTRNLREQVPVRQRSLLTRRVVIDLVALTEGIVIFITLACVHYLYHSLVVGPWYEWPRYMALFAGSAALATTVFRVAGLYH